MLQNALSFNYYANTHVYDPRANYLKKSDKPNDGSNPNKGTYDIAGSTTSLTAYTTTTDIPSPVAPLQQNQIETATNNDSNSAKPNANTTPASNTSGHTNTEIQKCLNIVSVKYKKDDVLGDYDISVTLEFQEYVGIHNFILKDTITAKLYILSDVGKNQKAFGNLAMHQNDSNTVDVQNNVLGSNSSDVHQLVYSYSGNKYNNTVPRNNIVLRYIVTNDEMIKSIDDTLKKPSPMFRIVWGTGGGFANCCFPYS
jgi:hypothetical protein